MRFRIPGLTNAICIESKSLGAENAHISLINN